MKKGLSYTLGIVVTAALSCGLVVAPSAAQGTANNCDYVAQEERITEAIDPKTDKYVILEGEEVDRFMSSLGFTPETATQVDKVYIFKAVRPNEVIVFFLKEGCIVYVQQTLRRFVTEWFPEEDTPERPRWDASKSTGVITVSTIDPGGDVGSYLEWWKRVRDSGLNVVIDGACISACTLVLGIVPDDKICMTPRGSFGFHMASDDKGPNDYLTSLLVHSLYPEWVQKWIEATGPLVDKPRFAYQEDFKEHIKVCK